LTRLFLVRHGSHGSLGHRLCGRTPGIGLNEAGKAETARLAKRLVRERIVAVYSSPLERAMETAIPIADALGLTIEPVEEINELELGSWSGQLFEALRNDPDWQRWNSDRGQHRAPGGESMVEVLARVAAWLEAAVRRHSEDAVVAVCHGDVIKAALAYVLGLSLDHHDRLQIDPGSISAIDGGPWGFKAVRINEVPE
jgi:broad specificity phosphatase PhoE